MSSGTIFQKIPFLSQAKISLEANKRLSLRMAVFLASDPSRSLPDRLDLFGDVKAAHSPGSVSGIREISAVNGARGLFIKQEENPVWVYVSIDEGEVFSRSVDKLCRTSFPWLTSPFFKTPDFQRLIALFAEHEDILTIRVREYVARSIIEYGSGQKRVRSKREWTDEASNRIFDRLKDERAWLESIQLFVERRGVSQNLRFSIGRTGNLTVHDNFELFYDTFLPIICSLSAEKLNFYKDRGRERSAQKQSRPLVIEYADNLFEDKSQNRRLISVLEKMPRSSLSVLHPNPYLRASLLDYRDGSSYDLWVLSGSRVVLVPKRRATSASLQEVCDYICNNFQEGTIRDGKEFTW